MALKTREQDYIKKVHLKGYKSIKDLEVELHPGLNIIIGANGSGKTNFIDFLWKVGMSLYGSISTRYFAKIQFSDGAIQKVTAHLNQSSKLTHIIGRSMSITDSLKRVDKEEITNSEDIDNSESRVVVNRKSNLNWLTKFGPILRINYGLPSNSPDLDLISYAKGHHNEFDLTDFVFIPDFYFINFFIDNIIPERLKVVDLSLSKKLLEIPIHFTSILSAYSPIKNLRFSDLADIKLNKTNIHIRNLKLEFLVNNEWLNWYELSDGTKRVFYIISQLFFPQKGLCLIEEPELGLHPDQLYKIMQFLKSQAEHKQIIVTTHSPQVLNTLSSDDLNRLIVCRYEKDKGTQMVNLSEEEKKYMISYMDKEGLWLSDYWVHSGIEAEQLEEND